MVDVGKYTVRPMDSYGFWEPSVLSDLYSFSGRCKRCNFKWPKNNQQNIPVGHPRAKIIGNHGQKVWWKFLEEKTHPPISGWKWKKYPP